MEENKLCRCGFPITDRNKENHYACALISDEVAEHIAALTRQNANALARVGELQKTGQEVLDRLNKWVPNPHPNYRCAADRKIWQKILSIPTPGAADRLRIEGIKEAERIVEGFRSDGCVASIKATAIPNAIKGGMSLLQAEVFVNAIEGAMVANTKDIQRAIRFRIAEIGCTTKEPKECEGKKWFWPELDAVENAEWRMAKCGCERCKNDLDATRIAEMKGGSDE
jgi:hypothetical protein